MEGGGERAAGNRVAPRSEIAAGLLSGAKELVTGLGFVVLAAESYSWTLREKPIVRHLGERTPDPSGGGLVRPSLDLYTQL